MMGFFNLLFALCFLLCLQDAFSVMAKPRHQPQFESQNSPKRMGNPGKRRREQQRRTARHQLSEYAWSVLDSSIEKVTEANPLLLDEEHIDPDLPAVSQSFPRRSQEITTATSIEQTKGRGGRGPKSRGAAGASSSTASKYSYIRYCSKPPTCQSLGERPRSELSNIDTRELKKTSACDGAHRLLRIQDFPASYYFNQTTRILTNHTRSLCTFEHESIKYVLEKHDISNFKLQDDLLTYFFTPLLVPSAGFGSSLPASQAVASAVTSKNDPSGLWFHVLLDEAEGHEKQNEKAVGLMVQEIELIRAHRSFPKDSLQHHVFTSNPTFNLTHPTKVSSVNLHFGPTLPTLLDSFVKEKQPFTPKFGYRKKDPKRVNAHTGGPPIVGITFVGHSSLSAPTSANEDTWKSLWSTLFPYFHRNLVIRIQHANPWMLQSMIEIMKQYSLGVELLPFHGSDHSILLQVHYIR